MILLIPPDVVELHLKKKKFTWKDSSLLQRSGVHTSALSGCRMQLGCSMGQEPSLGDLRRDNI